MMSQFGYNKAANKSIKKTIPLLKHDWLPEKSEQLPVSPFLMGMNRIVKGKRLMEKREKELKEILRPLMPINTKRPRSKVFIFFYNAHFLTLTPIFPI